MLQPLLDPVLTEADLKACRALLSNGSRTFYAASFLLPRRARDPATALYAFCRVADDAIDKSAGAPGAVDALRSRLDAAYARHPYQTPIDRALSATVHRFHVPRELLDALIEGFEWDARGRRYQTLAELEAYAARVAGTVGAMMSLLMGSRSPEQIARATDLGIAMQLTNIARDVGEDARMGRIYLPLAWLDEAGIDAEAWLQRPRFTPAIAALVERLLDVADGLYCRAESGIAKLPRDCRSGIYAARLLYAEIGHELARGGLDSVTRRAVVPKRRKMTLLARALLAAPSTAAPGNDHAPLAAARFLADAVATETLLADTRPEARGASEAGAGGTVAWWNVYSRTVRLIELIEALERRDRDAQSARAEPHADLVSSEALSTLSSAIEAGR